MIILTIILIVLPAILLVLFFTRQGINTSAELVINKSQTEVFNYLSSLKNQEHYNSWLMVDPGKIYSGTEGHPGLACFGKTITKKGEGIATHYRFEIAGSNQKTC